MNETLLRALITLMPVLLLLCGAAALYVRTKSVSAFVLVLGATCLVVVVLTHVCEALNLFPSLGWGAERSVGHYVDLASAILGIVLLAVGCLLYALRKRHAHAA
jgi:predicted membrane channel-forming protein YqfA (hemolysin III family)